VVGWFSSGKVEHPLADPKDSRKIIGELQADPLKAMGEVAYWLESINGTEGFRIDRRFDLLEEFEQFARPRLRKLAQDYLQVRQQKFQESRLWIAQADYWRHCAAGYVQCVEGFQTDAPGAGAIKARLPVIVGRALRSIGQQLKWLLLRYGPIDGSLWGDIGSLYVFAEAKGFAQTQVALFEGVGGKSSPREELLKILMLSAGSADSLLPDEIDFAERSVAWFAPRFVLEKEPEAGCTHVFDLAMRRPPARPHGASLDPSVRFFGAGPVFDEMTSLLARMHREGVLPSEINLGGSFEPKLISEVWRHLLKYWAVNPPERGSDRHASNARLTVLNGFHNLMGTLEPSAGQSLDFRPNTQASDTESWVAENASDGGYGAVMPAAKSDWVRVGGLLGVKSEEDKYWGVGVIRRLSRDDEQNRRVGIEMLSRHAFAVSLSPRGTIVPTNAVRDNDPGFLLTARPDADRQIQLLLRPGTYTPNQQLDLRVRGQRYVVTPTKLLEGAIEFDLAQFGIVQRVS
jgi:hypothetical protein